VKKDAKTFIDHILGCIELIEKYTENKTEDDFFTSVQLQDSVIRRIEIIGEAVKNIPDEIRKISRNAMEKDCRHAGYLVHKYFGVDLELTWRVVIRDIPDLKKKMLRIRKELK